MNCGIYLLKNKINGKIYIGQTVNFKRRMSEYRLCEHGEIREKRPISYAIRKHGWKNFEVFMLEFCDKSLFDERETYWIAKYNACQKGVGYNIGSGGNSHVGTGERNPFFGKHHSPEIRERLSKIAIERFKTKRHPNYGKNLSNEQKERVSKGLKDFYSKNDSHWIGKHHNETTKTKISLANKNKGNIPVKQIDKNNGQLIKIWPSIRTAILAIKGEIRYSHAITNACRQKFKTAFGFIWEYVNIEDARKTTPVIPYKVFISKPPKRTKLTPKEMRLKTIERNIKRAVPVKQINKITGEIIKIWQSSSQAAIGITGRTNSASCIWRVCAGGFAKGYKCLTMHGFKWAFATPEEYQAAHPAPVQLILAL